MSRYSEKIKKAKDIVNIQMYYDSLKNLMDWDLWQGLPKDGLDYRQKVSGHFKKEQVRMIEDPETKGVVDFFRNQNSDEYENQYDRALVRKLIRNYDNATKVPVDLQLEMDSFIPEAQMAWKTALKKSDFKLYKPYLKKMFELKTRIAYALNKNGRPFDVLVDNADEGLTVNETENLFTELKTAIVDILGRNEDDFKRIDDSILKTDCRKATIKRLCTHIAEKAFFDKNKGTYGEVIHPYSYGVGPSDVRITTHFNELFSSLFGTLHECGHGMYYYGSNEKVVDYGLWGGIPGAVDECMARFYENIIGKSKEFWTHFYPFLEKEIKKFRDVDLDSFYKAINRPMPSLKRIEADELTYSLHPIIRFEIEKDYFEGKIKTDEFSDVWNAKYKEYLGVEPKNAGEGVLQDVHWATGHVGYFQSYALGNIYGGQFRNKMLADCPDILMQISRGDFKELNEWNFKNIQQHGNLYTPKELIHKVTGEELKAKYFIKYLYEKFDYTNTGQ